MAIGLNATRKIGPWGTAARAAGGAAMLGGAAVIGIGVLDALMGLLVFPLAVIAALVIRGREASPLRLTGSVSCCLNLVVGAAALVLVPVAALLFYGTSLLVAAAAGDGGCEVFALSNVLRARDDEIACAVMTPIDAAERRARRLKH